MNDDIKLKKLNDLSQKIVLYVYSKIEYETTDKLHEECTKKLKDISDRIESLNNFEYPSNDKPTIVVCGYQLSPAPSIRLQMLYDQRNLINKDIKICTRELGKLYSISNELKSDIYLLSISLNCDDLINYFDIHCLNSDDKKAITDYIITNAINDLKNLYNSNITLSTPVIYKGKSTILELIINQKNICDTKINEYYNLKTKTEFIQTKINKVTDELDRVKARLARLQLTLVGKLLYKEEIEKSESDFRILNHALNDLRADCYLKKEKEEELKKDKIDACYRYIKICENLEELINELGEKSLKELIEKLNILVPRTENNFFNEKEEMKSALKNWFINENAKIMEEIENQTQSIEKSLERECVK